MGAATGDGVTALVLALGASGLPTINASYGLFIRITVGLCLFFAAVLKIRRIARREERKITPQEIDASPHLFIVTFLATLMDPIMVGANLGLLSTFVGLTVCDALLYGLIFFCASIMVQTAYGAVGWLLGQRVFKLVPRALMGVISGFVMLAWALVFIVGGVIDIFKTH